MTTRYIHSGEIAAANQVVYLDLGPEIEIVGEPYTEIYGDEALLLGRTREAICKAWGMQFASGNEYQAMLIADDLLQYPEYLVALKAGQEREYLGEVVASAEVGPYATRRLYAVGYIWSCLARLKYLHLQEWEATLSDEVYNTALAEFMAS